MAREESLQETSSDIRDVDGEGLNMHKHELGARVNVIDKACRTG